MQKCWHTVSGADNLKQDLKKNNYLLVYFFIITSDTLSFPTKIQANLSRGLT